MGEYELMMFLTADEIYVMEVDLAGNTKSVGFQGEECFHYEKIEDIDGFYNSLTEKYNVDNLSDLDARLHLIDCGMDKEIKWYLLDKLRSIEVLNFIDIANIIPILLSKKGLLQVGEQVVVEFLGKKYAYICDNNYRIEELSTRGKKAQQVLKQEEFAFMAVWEGNLSQGNKEKELKLENQVNELQTEIDKQKVSYDESVKELDNRCKSLEDENNLLKKQIQEMNRKKDEAASQEMISHRRIIKRPEKGIGRFVKLDVKNGAIIKANQKIGVLMFERFDSNLSNSKSFHVSMSSLLTSSLTSDIIYAPRAGKIVWLVLDGDELSDNGEEILGVVGDESDNIDDMLKWGRLKASAKV